MARRILGSVEDVESGSYLYATSQTTNAAYFRIYIDPETEEKQKQLDYTGYYKGRTLDKDLANFFFKIPYDKLQSQQAAADGQAAAP